jgi:hypothetical protein
VVADLAKPGLVYSGIYKDGWFQKDARLRLAGGPAAVLTLRADVTTKSAQHLDIFVNGAHVLSGATTGRLDLTATLPASNGPRMIELRWSTATPIGPKDPRSASALLTLIAVGRVAAATVTSAAQAPRGTHLRASLSVARETPPPHGVNAGEGGAFSGQVASHVLRWRLNAVGLSSRVVAAVIHAGSPGSVGARLVPLCAPCSSNATGSVALTNAQDRGLRSEPLYVNVGTVTNPGGEVQGAIRRS